MQDPYSGGDRTSDWLAAVVFGAMSCFGLFLIGSSICSGAPQVSYKAANRFELSTDELARRSNASAQARTESLRRSDAEWERILERKRLRHMTQKEIQQDFRRRLEREQHRISP